MFIQSHLNSQSQALNKIIAPFASGNSGAPLLRKPSFHLHTRPPVPRACFPHGVRLTRPRLGPRLGVGREQPWAFSLRFSFSPRSQRYLAGAWLVHATRLQKRVPGLRQTPTGESESHGSEEERLLKRAPLYLRPKNQAKCWWPVSAGPRTKKGFHIFKVKKKKEEKEEGKEWRQQPHPAVKSRRHSSWPFSEKTCQPSVGAGKLLISRLLKVDKKWHRNDSTRLSVLVTVPLSPLCGDWQCKNHSARHHPSGQSAAPWPTRRSLANQTLPALT